jgi:integrase
VVSVRMAKLRRDPSSGSWLSRKEIPKDIRDPYAAIYHKRHEEIFRAPIDCPAGRAKVLFSEWQSEIDSRFAALRAKQRGQGRDLTQRETFALAGEWYRWFISQHEESPGQAHDWEAGRWAFEDVVEEVSRETGNLDLSNPKTRAYVEKHAPYLIETADEFLTDRGETLSPAAMTSFLEKIADNLHAAMVVSERRAKGDYSPDRHLPTLPEMSARRSASSVVSRGVYNADTLSALQLFEANIKVAKLAPETILRRRGVFAELDVHLAGRSFDALSDDEAQEWITSLVLAGRNSAETVKSIYLASLKSLGRWAVKQRRIMRNPFENCSIIVPRKIQNRETRAFTKGEILTILAAAGQIKNTKRPTQAARRWVPWLCAYTGARAGEITQLRGKDIIERDGVRAIRVTPEAGTVKTKQARVVPIHEHLIELGLLDYVKQRGSEPLFYTARNVASANGVGGAGGVDPTKDVTKPQRARPVSVRGNLARWIRSIGITDPEVSPTHGWRHTFKQIADRCGISERVSDMITGHAPQTEGRKYGAPTLQDMAEAMKRFPRYPVD